MPLLLSKMLRSVILSILGALEETTQVTPAIDNEIPGTISIVSKWRGAFLTGLSIVCVCVCVIPAYRALITGTMSHIIPMMSPSCPG
jgi:hypothetical protein